MSALGFRTPRRRAASAYRHAEARGPIAEALNDRFATALHEPIARHAQQWWTTGNVLVGRVAPLFRDYEQVYGAGQFSWAGLWTVTDPPEVAHEQLVDAWELYGGAISRWGLPVLPEARVLEVHRPSDWAGLAVEYPRQAEPHQESWELPGGEPAANCATGSASGRTRSPTSSENLHRHRRQLYPCGWHRMAAPGQPT